jgi:hypothetical protein
VGVLADCRVLHQPLVKADPSGLLCNRELQALQWGGLSATTATGDSRPLPLIISMFLRARESSSGLWWVPPTATTR